MKQWTYREFTKVLKKNGYSLNRCRGSHSIFVNSRGNHISIPISLNMVIANRLIKENNLNTSI